MAYRRNYYRKRRNYWKSPSNKRSGSNAPKVKLTEAEKLKVQLQEKKKKLVELTTLTNAAVLAEKERMKSEEQRLSSWLRKNKLLYSRMTNKLGDIQNELAQRGLLKNLFSDGQLEDDKSKLSTKVSIYQDKERQAQRLRTSIVEIDRNVQATKSLRVEISQLEVSYKTQSAKEKQEKLEKQKRKEERERAAAQREQNKKRKQEETKAKAAAYDDAVRKLADSVKRKLIAQYKSSHLCPYCEDEFSAERNKVHADHIYPVHKGGLSTTANMVLICQSCNSAKSDLTLRVFCKKRGFDFEKVCGRLEKLGKDV